MNLTKNLDSSGDLLIDFSNQPISNRFLSWNCMTEAPTFPLQLRIDPDSGLIHQGKPFPLTELKPRYEWITCFEPEEHLDDLVQQLIKLPGVSQSSVFGAYSFKDDSTLRRLERLGYINNWRIDPVKDLGISDPCANVETYQSAFTLAKAKEIFKRHGPADVFIVRHVVEHAYDLTAFIEAIKRMISPGGYIVWEIPDCERALSIGDCTTVWEEHIFYFTSVTFKQVLLEFGFSIFHFKSVPYPLENSLVAITQQLTVKKKSVTAEPQVLAKEIGRAQRFVKMMNRRRVEIRKKLEALNREKGPIAVFGAGHLSVAFISMMQVADLISCVVDDNPNKKGMRMPIGKIPIIGSEALYTGEIKVCLLGLNPQNHAKVIAKHIHFTEQGGIFASIFPVSELNLEHIN